MSTAADIVPSAVTGSAINPSGSTIQRQSSLKLVEDWTKSIISQLKKSNASEKNELQRLNAELKVYLDNTKALENLNKKLLDEVEKARNRALPSIMDKTENDRELETMRQRLEQESLEVVQNQIKIEENQSLNQHLSDRIRFFSKEADLQRQKILALQNQLADINNQRESLLRSATLAEDDRKREEERAEQAEKTLASLRKQLGESRLKHKKVEFELQSVVDEIEFRKALFQEEANDLRTRYNSLGNVIPGVDINDFYKKELHNAIRQIKEDFHTLNQQQLDDYKRNKEFELAAKTREIENERKQAELVRSKLLAANDVESQNSVELKNNLTKEKTELEQERSRHNQLVNKLGQLEERLKNSREGHFFILEKLQNEIDTLRDQNSTYSNELAFWDKVTRLKLEAEIQTYRSILNSQLKLMQTALPQGSGGSFSGATVVDINANSKPYKQSASSTGNRMEAKSKDDAINILRQIFNYFDRDKSGKINSFELDEILQRMNIQLTLESYNQLLKEFDKDCKLFKILKFYRLNYILSINLIIKRAEILILMNFVT
jgi:Ca2+-binding EF-hand superfamily protein